MKVSAFQLRKNIAAVMAVSLFLVPLLGWGTAHAAVSNTIAYQGRLLSGPTTPAANLNFEMRFSLWSDADFVDGIDRNGSGALVGTIWQEEVPMVTDS